MLLVIYNSNRYNKPELPTYRGWSLLTKQEWESLCIAVDDYFSCVPSDYAELSFKLVSYYSYHEWLDDYQVSEVEIGGYEYDILYHFLGTDFYIPDTVVQPDDEPIYPEMDAYA